MFKFKTTCNYRMTDRDKFTTVEQTTIQTVEAWDAAAAAAHAIENIKQAAGRVNTLTNIVLQVSFDLGDE